MEFEGKQVYLLTASAQSLKRLRWLISGRARIDSYVDVSTNNPVIFKQKLMVKGKPETDKTIRYEQKEQFMVIGDVKRHIMPNTQDPLSAIYNIRKADLGENGNLEFNINTNQKNYVLEAAYRQPNPRPAVRGELNRVHRESLVGMALLEALSRAYHVYGLDVAPATRQEGVDANDELARIVCSEAMTT